MNDPQHTKHGAWVSEDAVKHERELRIAEIQRLWDAIKNLERLLDERKKSDDEARDLYAVGNKEHLGALNESHKRADQIAERTLLRNDYARDLEIDRAWKGKADQAIDRLQTAVTDLRAQQQRDIEQATRNGQRNLTIVGLLLAALSFAMRFFQ